MSLRDHLDSFHRAIGKIDDYGFAESIDIKEEIRPAKQAVTNAKIDLVDGSVLHIRVYIDAKYKIEVISYAKLSTFHWCNPLPNYDIINELAII
jgi:hypothetical protein